MSDDHAPRGFEGLTRTMLDVPGLLEELGIQLGPTLDIPRSAEFAARGEGDGDGDSGPEELPEAVGRFEVLGELGRGGMGRVLLCKDPDLRREVAIKLVLDPARAETETLARFVAEAQVTAQLEHPSIVPVHDLGATEDGRIFYVMKRVVGRTLAELLIDRRKGEAAPDGWTPHRLLAAFAQVCRAVQYAHERGVLHRDLKPANLIFGAHGEVQVADWGLARVLGGSVEVLEVEGGDVVEPGTGGWRSLGALERSHDAAGEDVKHPSGSIERLALSRTLAGTLRGSPGYMSPEHASGSSEIAAPADVFSLGAVLYELATLKPAFAGGTVREVINRIQQGPPPDPRQAAPDAGISDELAGICNRALAHDPADRYPTAAKLAEAVEAFLEGRERRERALELLAEARTLQAGAAHRRRHGSLRRRDAAALLAGVAPSAGEALKAPAWDLEDEADELERAAALQEVEFEERTRAALELAPDLADARSLLADHYRALHEAAEAGGDGVAAARLAVLLAAHDRGAHAEYLRGAGTVSLRIDPPDSDVRVRRYRKRQRRLQTETVLAIPDLEGRLSLPVGSYLLTVSAPGRRAVRYPVQVGRTQSWDATRPGADAPTTLRLPLDGELGEDDCLVPAGWAPTGGDAQGAGSFPARRIWVDGFVMRRFPVTHGEYVDWLAALVDGDRAEEAAARVPRETAGGEGERGAALYQRDEEGRYALPATIQRDWAVTNVDWESAAAYAADQAARTGLAWRLPCELEWEKAARGVDGRYFPWGATHDPAWCLTLESHAGAPTRHGVDSYPVDESPYGVRGLAGGVRDWCLDPFVPAGPDVVDGVLVLPDGGAPELPHVTRGGAWSLPDWVGRACVRGFHPPIQLQDLGFRLVRSVE